METKWCHSCSKFRPAAGFVLVPGTTRPICSKCNPERVVWHSGSGDILCRHTMTAKHNQAVKRTAGSEQYIKGVLARVHD